MTYRISDVEAAKAQIAAALPDARFGETDFGFGLEVYYRDKVLTVFKPERLDIAQHEVVNRPSVLIAALSSLPSSRP